MHRKKHQMDTSCFFSIDEKNRERKSKEYKWAVREKERERKSYYA
jgi:hypothetical protein